MSDLVRNLKTCFLALQIKYLLSIILNLHFLMMSFKAAKPKLVFPNQICTNLH